ncbi:MAG TPA: hypothetical protein VKA03_00965 [Methylovirgula sp.]|nr:hypothetical protein [Methylovirgula sp.]
MTVIDRSSYWDGGLFDNTPIEALLDLLSDAEIDSLPIFVVDLFATRAALPQNLAQVFERMMEIAYENRFWAQYADPKGGLAAFTSMLAEIDRDLPSDSPVRAKEPYHRLQRLRALRNLRIIQADHAPMTGSMDFSAYGVKSRFDSGRAAVDKMLAGTPTH